MIVSRGLFGWSPPHMQPLTPVSEVSEPPESPSPFPDPSETGGTATPAQVEADEEMEEPEEVEPPPAAVPFSQLFACADRFDWVLMILGSVAAAAHGTALIVYLHYFVKIVEVLAFSTDLGLQRSEDQFDRLVELSLIAHRAAMMRHVDNIVVLNGGRIVEEGTHDSLAAKNGSYVGLMQPHFGKGLRQHRPI